VQCNITFEIWSRDKREFPSKIAKFYHPRVCFAPAEGFCLGIVQRHWGQK